MTIDDARIEYNKVVRDNLKNIRAGKLKSPDCTYTEYVLVEHSFLYAEDGAYEMEISLAPDAICGDKTIDKMVSLYPDEYERKSLYKLIRDNRFDCLIWPTYAISINQMRYAVYRDRVDLTLMDVERFYNIIEDEAKLGNAFSDVAFDRIEKECRLSKAYLNFHTLAWMCSFKNFSDFVEKRGLKDFVEYDGKKYHATAWAGSDTRINSEDFKVYFERLVDVMGKMA
ncbi:hypothetical protein SAMN02745111_01165 [Eubacterium uniforme]|uniref:Uncharacterized protein n=1 Tax=Eubacterium uniforme TaxID=39495 RepID=A0A1T4VL38_9FIRM|nr:hypothetical protein [Eubacterium uniforme]SKA65680.1 hypothetical protein SAMN02745111_01165 [Eubacterium uniforme]